MWHETKCIILSAMHKATWLPCWILYLRTLNSKLPFKAPILVAYLTKQAYFTEVNPGLTKNTPW